MNQEKIEIGPIVTPSEQGSLFLRINRNCPWNKCLFCPVYKGKNFSERSLEEIFHDIDIISTNISKTSMFLQDADPLKLDTNNLIKILERIKEKIPQINRITCYASARTISEKSISDLIKLHQIGLTGIYIGLESGYNEALRYMKKGLTFNMAIRVGLKAKEAGLELNFFVLSGITGKLDRESWKTNALENAKVLNEVNPDFIRLRTLCVVKDSPLYDLYCSGNFKPLSTVEVLEEQKLLIESLSVTSSIESNKFITNCLRLEANFAKSKGEILKIIDEALQYPGDFKIPHGLIKL